MKSCWTSSLARVLNEPTGAEIGALVKVVVDVESEGEEVCIRIQFKCNRELRI
jgi:hypothetical protein